jgi:hypothetical protein
MDLHYIILYPIYFVTCDKLEIVYLETDASSEPLQFFVLGRTITDKK